MTTSRGFNPVISPADLGRQSGVLGWAQVFRWSLAALIVGAILRVVMLWQAPYGIFVPSESAALVLGAGRSHSLLASALYQLPFLLGFIALIFIPVVQHLLGLSLVFVAGLMCHAWFRRWRWFIVPGTLFFAVNPHFLHAEHSLSPESLFLWTSMILALAGTVYLRRLTWPWLAFLCLALTLQAMAAPQGRWFFLFGILLIYLLHRREWAWLVPRLLAIAIVSIAGWLSLASPRAGLDLFAGVAPLAPARPLIAPETSGVVRFLRNRDALPHDRAAVVASSLGAHLKRHRTDEVTARDVNALAMRLGIETSVRNLHRLPGVALGRFLSALAHPPFAPLGEEDFLESQLRAYRDDAQRLGDDLGGLLGRQPRSPEDLERFVIGKFPKDRLRWLARWQETWQNTFWGIRLADTEDDGSIRIGLPLSLVIFFVGLLVAMIFPARMRRFHIAWGCTLLIASTVSLLSATGAATPALALTPFLLLYGFLLLDLLARIPMRHSRN